MHLGFGGTTDDDYYTIGWIYIVNGPAVSGVPQFVHPRAEPAQVSVRMWVGSGRVGTGPRGFRVRVLRQYYNGPHPVSHYGSGELNGAQNHEKPNFRSKSYYGCVL